MQRMNRRQFTQMFAAFFAAPAVPTGVVAAPQASATPAAARFWAIYMTGLHGDVSPNALSQLSGLSVSQATSVRAELIRDNVINPTGLIKKVVSTAARSNPNSEQLSSFREFSEDLAKDMLDHEGEQTTDANDEEHQTDD